jgi:hypothetical protein
MVALILTVMSVAASSLAMTASLICCCASP